MDGCCMNCGEEGNWCRCDEDFYADKDDWKCLFPASCVMGFSEHHRNECLHFDAAAGHYEMLEKEFLSTEEVGGES